LIKPSLCRTWSSHDTQTARQAITIRAKREPEGAGAFRPLTKSTRERGFSPGPFIQSEFPKWESQENKIKKLAQFSAVAAMTIRTTLCPAFTTKSPRFCHPKSPKNLKTPCKKPSSSQKKNPFQIAKMPELFPAQRVRNKQ
jgi:hypothetical protein